MMISMELLNNCYSKLFDEKSKEIFDMRLKLSFDGIEPDFLRWIYEKSYNWEIEEFDRFDERYDSTKGIIVFGSGIEGLITEQILSSEGYSVFAYCDNDPQKWGKETPTGKMIFSPTELQLSDNSYFYIVASRHHGLEIYAQIKSSNIASDNDVFLPRYGTISALHGNQYFDCEHVCLQDGEVFVDMGAYDGKTIKYVTDNCNYKRVIGFEPSPVNIKICNNTLSGLPSIELVQAAAWCKEEKLHFNINDSGSSIKDWGTVDVVGLSLDDILDGDKATFIKMDVEGSEKEAIEGASKTIETYKPKLAICVYHKPEDIFAIPSQVLDIRDDYRFVLRHYSSRVEETILYAF